MRTISKQYELSGVKGLAASHKARSSKVIVKVYQTQQAGLNGLNPWTIVCEHGNTFACNKFPEALKAQGQPEAFCPECKRLMEQHAAEKAAKNDPNRPKAKRGRKPKVQTVAVTADTSVPVIECVAAVGEATVESNFGTEHPSG